MIHCGRRGGRANINIVLELRQVSSQAARDRSGQSNICRDKSDPAIRGNYQAVRGDGTQSHSHIATQDTGHTSHLIWLLVKGNCW